MKRVSFLVSLIFLILVQVSSAQENWPYTEFKYVKAYLYNLDSEVKPNFLIIRDNKLDSTVIGEGILLNDEQSQKIISITNNKVRGLLYGLSKTFLPHHALVFYDENDQVVAHMSIGFDCEGIKTIPKIGYKEIKKVMSKKEIEFCETQLAIYKQIFLDLKFPVFDHFSQYQDYKKEINK